MRFAPFALVLFLLLPSLALAVTLEFSWQNSARFEEEMDAATFRTEVAGRPALPLEALSFVIPEGMRVRDARLIAPESESFILADPLPRFEGLIGSEGSIGALSSQDWGVFPERHLLSWSTVSYRGIRTAELVLAPWLWTREDSGETIQSLRSATFRIDLEPDPQAIAPLRAREANWKRSLAKVEARVLNPEDLAARAPRPELEDGGGLFRPRAMPSVEGSGVDMVIVTTTELEGLFQELADYKTVMGISTVVRTLDWIYGNYPQGADPQETLRRFIQDAYRKWGIEFLILAGDSQFIPARYARSNFIYPPVLLPSDLYYAALDGNWNADGDQYFGESTYGGVDGDDADLAADVLIGRLPVSDVESASLIIEKIITYAESPNLDYLSEATFLGEVLFPDDYELGDPDESITRNGTEYCEPIYNEFLPPQINGRRLYETYWLYPGSEPELLATVISDLNERAHFVHHVGHGFRYNMSVGEGNFMIEDAEAMNNGLDHLINVYAMNCTSCAFDYNCLGEAFLLAEEGGGLTTIGSVREAFPQTAVYYQDAYWESAFADSCSIGESFTWSHNKYVAQGQLEGSHRWTQLAIILLGDPSTELWMDRPDTLALALTEPFTLSSDTLKVYLSEDGNPIGNAKVVAVKSGEDRATGFTDAMGLLSLPFHADSPGTVEIHATANNMLPLHVEIDADADAGPRLSVAGLLPQDDPALDAAIQGNADGRADAGEWLRLAFTLRNLGDAQASAPIVTLASPGGELTVHEASTAALADIPAGDSLELDLSFLVSSDFDLSDRSSVLLDFQFSYGEGQSNDLADLDFAAPDPRLLAFTLDDSAGDGDGEMDAGETVIWTPEWKNYGNTPIEGWQATMSALDPEGAVISGPVALPLLGLLEDDSSAGIQLSESDTATPHRFELLLSGPLGETRRDTLTLRRPAAPGAPLLDSSREPTIIDLVWEEPDSNAVGYFVLISLSEGGPYERHNSEPSSYTYYRADGLTESTRYYFVVESVDSSGFRSAISPESTESTNPSMQAGWPADTGLGTASSLVIGDLDGDGDKEIVSGSNRIYAWHHDGAEVRDGDADSGTYGVFSDLGERYTASIAMAQIDPASPGLEIVAASRETQEFFVLDGEGNVLPGFPKSHSLWSWATPSVADVDNDGFMEIFDMCLDGNLYAWNHDGTPYLGNPNGIFAGGIGSWSKSSPSLGQLDGDPELEVVVGTNWGVVWVWEHDGSVKSGWPKGVSEPVNSSASLGDLDGDGTLEIVLLGEADRLYAFNADGSDHAPNFPVTLICNAGGLAPSPVLVDFEDDGEMEIVAVGVIGYHSMDVVIYDQLGVVQNGWPIHLDDSSESSPVVVDLDGDRELEILLGTEAGYLYAWERDGSSVPGFPILTEAELRSSPTVDDIDDDLDVEVTLMGWDSWVYIWDMPTGYYNGLAHWRMFRANPARTGVFTREDQITDLEETAAAPAEGLLYPNYPNPFNPKTEIRFATPAGSGMTDVKLAVYDIQGRLVRTLFEGGLTRGSTHRYEWDGLDDRDRPVTSGVYFAKIRMDETKQSRKMLLLK